MGWSLEGRNLRLASQILTFGSRLKLGCCQNSSRSVILSCILTWNNLSYANLWPPMILDKFCWVRIVNDERKSEVKRFQRKCFTIWRQDLINSLFLYKLTITRYHTKYIKNDKFTFYVLSKCKFITIRFIYLFDVLLTDIADLRIKNTD